jgi:pantothenate synthetase
MAFLAHYDLNLQVLVKTQRIPPMLVLLEKLETVRGKALISMAVLMGKTRLIDNFVMG